MRCSVFEIDIAKTQERRGCRTGGKRPAEEGECAQWEKACRVAIESVCRLRRDGGGLAGRTVEARNVGARQRARERALLGAARRARSVERGVAGRAFVEALQRDIGIESRKPMDDHARGVIGETFDPILVRDRVERHPGDTGGMQCRSWAQGRFGL